MAIQAQQRRNMAVLDTNSSLSRTRPIGGDVWGSCIGTFISGSGPLILGPVFVRNVPGIRVIQDYDCDGLSATVSRRKCYADNKGGDDMKSVLLVVLLGLMLLCVSGCLTTKQQTRLNEMTAEQKAKVEALVAESIAAYKLIETQTAEVKSKVETGTINLSDGQAYIAMLNTELNNTVQRINAQIQETKRAYSDEKEQILDEGNSKMEYYGGLAVAFVLNFFGVNIYRNRKHPLTTSIGNG